jgi:predicted ATP-dependent protease
LSGRLHDKGMQIIAGYLRSQFAQDKPLSLAASICFEQSYTGIEGDSASSSEVYALLSALSNLPARQDIAITGSVNQQGVIQPIGGANQKIEGFYDVCRVLGFTGTQGVLIPIENVEDLMLRDDVIEAVAAGKFHLYPVAHVEQGIEILTGVPAGCRDAGGHFQPDTVFGRVDDRLRHMAVTLKQFE